MLPDVIRDIIASESNEVQTMKKRIEKAIYDRALFERQKAPNASHVELRRVAGDFINSTNAAAFFVLLNADPDLIFNRVRKEGTRASLKGLRKIKCLIDYIMGNKDTLDIVSKALFASTIVAANKGVEWIASPEQEYILSPESVNSLPKDIREAIYTFQHKHMTIEGDARHAASHFRTTFANLGFYTYAREEFDNSSYQMGIVIDLHNPVIIYLNERWGLNNV